MSIWTTSGRVKNVAFTASPEQLATPALYRKGESDLLERDGMWFLDATCEVPEAPLNTGPVDFLGVDLGLVNIATTSDGEIMAGRELNRTRLRERGLRTKLQKKNTPSAKRRLKKRRRKEARRARDINHKIAKHVVTEAGGTSHALYAVGEHRSRNRPGRPGRPPITGTSGTPHTTVVPLGTQWSGLGDESDRKRRTGSEPQRAAEGDRSPGIPKGEKKGEEWP